tara:strand:+ start:507 stop:659 length:153 start_codon:yes stop_codon:yes gene_type:complete
MQNKKLWRKLEEDYGVARRWTLKEVAIGLIAGTVFAIACGWLYLVTVMAR